MFHRSQKAKKQGFNVLQTLKAKRTWISFFAICKKLKQWKFYFLQTVKKLKKTRILCFTDFKKPKKTKIYYLQTLKIELKKWILILQTV